MASELYNFEGYKHYYNQGSVNRSDGVIVYVRSDIEHESTVVCIDNLNIVRIEIIHNNMRLALNAIYRSSSTDYKIFLDTLDKYIHHIYVESTEVVVGDINANILSSDTEATNYLNLFSENGYQSCINKTTRIEGNAQSCLDHIMVKSKMPHNLFTPIVLKSAITDHFRIILVT